MDPAIVVGLLWVGFGCFHFWLGAPRVRARLVDRFGELGFTAFFSLVATVWFIAVVAYYAAHRWEGAAGLALGQNPALRWILMAAIASALMLATAGLVAYPRLPTALFGQAIRTPRGIERITRHPFFAGVAILGLAHVFLATRLVGTVFALGLALVAIIGARLQDAKFLVRRGPPYAEYLRATSFVPFGAIVSGRQTMVWSELPGAALAVGLGLAFLLRFAHDGLFAHGGAWIVAAVLGGAATASVQSFRRARRHGVTPAAHSRSA